MRILIQVHTWNDADVIGTALDAILHQTLSVDEIVIVDNGSDDGTAELEYPDLVTVIRHPVNLGTSGSVKTGLEYARAEHLAVIALCPFVDSYIRRHPEYQPLMQSP